MGQSLAPTLAALITALLAVIGALVSGMAGVKLDANASTPSPLAREVTAVPLAAFVLGLAAGGPMGVHARTHDWFGLSAEQEVRDWVALGLDKKEVARRLFESRFPATASERKRLWLGEDPAAIVEPWVKLGLDKKVLAQEVFEQLISTGAETVAPAVARDLVHSGLLFNDVPREECARYAGLGGTALMEKMQGGSEEVRKLVKYIREDKLEEVMRQQCKP